MNGEAGEPDFGSGTVGVFGANDLTVEENEVTVGVFGRRKARPVKVPPAAKLPPQVRVRFLAEDGAVISSRYYEIGAKIEAPQAPEKPDAVFSHWHPEVPENAQQSGEYWAVYSAQKAKKKPKKRNVGKWVLAVALLCVVILGAAVGTRLYNGWVTIGGNTYRFYQFKKLTGWWKIEGSYYYFGPDGQLAPVGWSYIDGVHYYFGENGLEERPAPAGFSADSIVWTKGNDSGTVVSKWKWINGKRYYFGGADGTALTGWWEIAGYCYYFDSEGAAVTGWQEIDGAQYYFTSSGRMVTGEWTVGGKIYQFSENGKLIE